MSEDAPPSRRRLVLRASIVLLAVALALVLAGAAAIGPRRLFAMLRVSRAEVAECEKVRDLVLEVANGRSLDLVLREVFAVVPAERFAHLSVVRKDARDSGLAIFTLTRAGGQTGTSGSWDESTVVGHRVIESSAPGQLYPWQLRLTEAEVQSLVRGPLEPIALGLARSNDAVTVKLKPLPAGTELFVYAWNGDHHAVEISLTRR